MSSDPGHAQSWISGQSPAPSIGELRYTTPRIFSKEEAMPARTREDLRSIVTETLVSVATNAQADPMARIQAAQLLLDRHDQLASSSPRGDGQ